MSDDLSKCPWCGCGLDVLASHDPVAGYANWACGSFKRGAEPYQSEACKLSAAESHAAELQALFDLQWTLMRETTKVLRARIGELEAEVARLSVVSRDLGARCLTAGRERDAALAREAALREALEDTHDELCNLVGAQDSDQADVGYDYQLWERARETVKDSGALLDESSPAARRVAAGLALAGAHVAQSDAETAYEDKKVDWGAYNAACDASEDAEAAFRDALAAEEGESDAK